MRTLPLNASQLKPSRKPVSTVLLAVGILLSPDTEFILVTGKFEGCGQYEPLPEQRGYSVQQYR